MIHSGSSQAIAGALGRVANRNWPTFCRQANPKSEARNPKQIQSTKPACLPAGGSKTKNRPEAMSRFIKAADPTTGVWSI
jgi:hypothetical protein